MFVFVMAQLVLTQCFGPQTVTIPELNDTMVDYKLHLRFIDVIFDDCIV